VGCGGQERTEAQFRQLLGDSGMALRAVRSLASGFSVLSAARAEP
jgi:hypothetical protein